MLPLLKELVVYAGFKMGKDFAADLASAAAGSEDNSDSGDGAESGTRFGTRIAYGEFVGGRYSYISISNFSIGFVASFPVVHTELSFSSEGYDYDHSSYGYQYNNYILNADILYRGCPFGGPNCRRP